MKNVFKIILRREDRIDTPVSILRLENGYVIDNKFVVTPEEVGNIIVNKIKDQKW